LRITNCTGIGFALRVVLILCIVLAMLGDTRTERLPIKTYTTADGLARDRVNRIVQDSKGFLWFCTTEGLSRFDGYKFTNYGTEQGLASRQVTDFLETRSGTYWAATDRGLCRFNPDPLPPARLDASPQRFVVYYPREEAAARSVHVIYEDHAGTIWCGTSAGLFRLDQAGGNPVFSFVDIILPSSLEDDKLSVDAAIEDRRGSLWLIAQSGLYRRRQDGTVERYTMEEGLQEGRSAALLEDLDGRIWVGTALGLYELVTDPKPHQSAVARRYTVKDGLPDNYVAALCQSSDGKLWAGTGFGLCEFLPAQDRRDGRFKGYAQSNGLSNPQVTTLTLDRDRNLWIGTASGGAMRLAADGFATYDEQDGLGGTRVASIVESRDGELCVVGTNTVISKFEHGRFTAAPLTLPKGLSFWGWGWYQVTFQDRTGDWWIPSFGGLVRYARLTSPGQITRARPTAIYTTRDGLPTNQIFRLFEDSRGDIWISTLGDPKGVLTRWERATGTFHRYSPQDGIPEAAPTAFCEDGSGNLWIGLYEGGLLRYTAGRFTPFTRDDGVPPGLIWGFHLDHEGRLWIATGEGGLARMDHPGAERPSFISYTTAEGLSSNQATCVTEDKWGMIYVGTGRGLNKLDPATGHIRRYTVADGLANSFINVSFRQGDGSLWFGTLRGLSRLIPQPEPPTSPPLILITGLHVAGAPYPIPELGALTVAGPVLGANQNNVQVDFSGVNLAVAESLRYQYKLEGASSQWSAPTDQRTVTYANLAPGSYRFWVRALNSDGTTSEMPAAASFIILPPVWRSWWFIALVGTLLALAVYALYRYRVRRLLEIERVRTRIAADLHDDIGANLTRIGILSEVANTQLQAEQPRISSPLISIAQISRECVASMGDIVWAIDPARDHLIDLVQRMRRFAREVLSNRKIQFQFRAPPGDEDLTLGADVRRNVFLVFKEAVNNAARHAECSSVTIDLTLEGSRLVLKVGDNGSGFDTFESVEGHGLASMKRRAADLGGELRLASAKGQGTEIVLTVPRKVR
jgi:ligand-binding sensor domain-containing protein/two-component sensor histidine kinase